MLSFNCRIKPTPFCSADQNVAAPWSFLTLTVLWRICEAAPVLETVGKTVEASVVSVSTMSTDQKVINLSFWLSDLKPSDSPSIQFCTPCQQFGSSQSRSQLIKLRYLTSFYFL